MPDATITSTASTFGTITGTFAADQSTVTGTVTGIVAGTLTGSVGVPGPQGPAGSQGPQGQQGPQGDPGVGVPAGGTAGQFLTKTTTGVDYATNWSTLSLTGYATESWVTAGFYPLTGNPSGFLTASSLTPYLSKAGNLAGLTDLTTARDNLNLGTANTPVFAGLTVQGSGANVAQLTPTSLTLTHTTSGSFTIQPSQGIVFPNASIQTTAWNDAPSDGTIYGRQNGSWVTSGGGDYLPLAGGALDANASITASDTSTATDSELAGWGLGVELSADHTKGTTVEFDGLDTYDGSNHMQVTPTGLTFPDSTVQTTAYTGGGGYITSVSSPLGVTSGDLSIDLTGYATESYVTSQGYITQTTADGLYYDITNPSGFIAFDAYNRLKFTPLSGPPSVWTQGELYFSSNKFGYTTTGSQYNILATEAWVSGTYAPLASPTFTGTPLAPTASTGTSSTQIATTAFVQNAVISGSAHAETLQATVRNNTGATLSPFTVVYINGALGNNTTVAKAQANSEATSSGTFAVTQAAISNNADGIVISAGVLSNIDTSAYTDGDKLYLSPTTAGAVTTTKPSAPNHLVYVGVVTRSHPTQGTVSVRIQNGYELDELHDVAITSKTDLDLLSYESSTSLWKNKSFSTLGLATLASPTFSGTPSLPTGTTATTQTAGDNSTKLATTAFVTAAVPAFATNAQAIIGTSSTTALAPSVIGAVISHPELRPLNYFTQTAVSGSGGVTSGAIAYGQREMYTSATLSAGRAAWSYGIVGANANNMSRADFRKLDFSKKVWMSGKAMVYSTTGFGTSYPGDANTFSRITLGGYTTNTTGDMTAKGIGWKKQGGSTPFFTLTVHNGTTLTDVATTIAPTDNQSIDWVVYSDGAGNVTLYINGAQAATTTAGPTGTTANYANAYREQVEATASAAARTVMECTGGFLYIEG